MSDEFDDDFSDFGRDEIIALMIEEGATPEEAEATYEERKTQIDESLKKAEDSPFNTALDGAVSAHVGKRHFRLRKAIVLSVTLTCGLVTTGAAVIAIPAVGAATGAVLIATTLERLGDLFKKMSDTEFLVYEAMLEISANTSDGKHITLQYLEAWFQRHSDAPPENIAEILNDLRIKGIVKSDGQGTEKTYSILS